MVLAMVGAQAADGAGYSQRTSCRWCWLRSAHKLQMVLATVSAQAAGGHSLHQAYMCEHFLLVQQLTVPVLRQCVCVCV